MPQPKNCSTCAHCRVDSYCRRTGCYCETEIRYPKLCGGKDLPLYHPKDPFVQKVIQFFKKGSNNATN